MSEPDRVMVDIETLGLEPGCAILSIGAVRFDADGVGDEFYQSVDLQSCQDAGLTIDAGTLDWWLGQDDAITGVLTGGLNLDATLVGFTEFYGLAEEIWANSPSFDCEILEAAYAAVGREEPWGFRDERCVRTLRSLPGAVDVEMDGEEHHALDDAKQQARSVAATLRELGARTGGRG